MNQYDIEIVSEILKEKLNWMDGYTCFEREKEALEKAIEFLEYQYEPEED